MTSTEGLHRRWLRAADAGDAAASLRERKKRLTSQRISDVATRLFLQRGFDEVTVAEIAAACDVSEKTVYNYFPTKESLLLDREPALAAAIRASFGPDATEPSPVRAAVQLLETDLAEMVEWWHEEGMAGFRRFAELLDTVPSLRSANLDMVERLTRVAAEAFADRAGVDPSAPEPQIAARALMGLWGVHYNALRHHASLSSDPAEVAAAVIEETRRAARLLETGLWAFTVMVQDTWTREQLDAAAELTRRHLRQVASAVRQARRTWRAARGPSGHR